MEGALRARLLAAPAVTDRLASWQDEKAIFWVERPQRSGLNAITLQIIDEDREQHMAGFQKTQRAVVQIDIWAVSYAAAKALKEAVIATLTPRATVEGIRFDRSFVRALDRSETHDGKLIFRPSLDFTIHYSPA
jgi:hypothetical protein